MATPNTIGYELGWDDEISQESTFVLLEEGDYRFKVANFERGRHTGSARLPACNKAILTLDIFDAAGRKLTSMQHNLFLHSSVEGMISAFFLSIGLKKHGEPLKMNWGTVTGAEGWCHVYVDKWTNDKGEEKQNNKIKYFLDPEEAAKKVGAPAPAPAQAAPQQQAFTGWGAGAATNWSAR